MPKKNGLTPKQARFVNEYLIDLNATQAAIRAGYSVKSAELIGHQQLKKTKVQEKIAAAMAKREAKTEITQQRVLQETARLAFSNPKDVFSQDFTLVPPHKLPDEVAAAISSIKKKKLLWWMAPFKSPGNTSFGIRTPQLTSSADTLAFSTTN